jgi:hypothetical protein
MKKVLCKVLKLVKNYAGFLIQPGPLTPGLSSARPEKAWANFGRPGLEPGRIGPYGLELGPSRAKKGPSRIGPAREQH